MFHSPLACCICACLVVAFVQSDVVLLPCLVQGRALSQSGVINSSSCTNISFVDVSISGNSSTLNVSLTSLLMLNSTASLSVTISFLRLALLDGASLVIDSTSATPAASSPPPALVSIFIKSLLGRNGAMAFTGAFPPGTVILVSDVNITADNAQSVPRFSMLDSIKPRISKMLLIVNLTLMDNSSFIIERMFLTILDVLHGGNCTALALMGNVTIANMSSMVMVNLTLNTTDMAGIYSHASAIQLINGSFWSITGASLTAIGGAFVVEYTYLSVYDHSEWLISLSNFSGSVGVAFRVSSTRTYIIHSSSWIFSKCFFVGRSMAIFLLDEQVWQKSETIFSDLSTVAFLDCSFSALSTSSICFCTAVNVTRMSSLWFQGCIFSSTLWIGFSIAGPVALSGESSMMFALCHFEGYVAGWSIANTSLTLNSSRVQVSDSQFRGTLCAMIVTSLAARLTHGSSLLIKSSQLSAGSSNKAFGVLLLGKSQLYTPKTLLMIDRQSNWTYSGCTIKGLFDTPAILFAASSVQLSNGSSWNMLDCYASAVASVIVFNTARITMSQSSEMIMLRSTFLSTTGIGPAIALLAASQMVVSGFSMFSVMNGSLVGPITASIDSLLHVRDASALVVCGIQITVSSSGPGVALSCGVTISASSMLMLRKIVIQVSSTDHCMDVGLLAVEEWGTVRVLDNECFGTSGDGSFLIGSVDKSLTAPNAFPFFVSRCNAVRGAVQRRMWQDAGIFGASALPCSHCDAAVDCFWPLTEVSSLFTRIACGDITGGTAPECPCMAECGSVREMCLPGPQTYLAILRSVDSCVVNGEHNVRPVVSQTASGNVTLSAAITPSTTQLPQIFGNSVNRAFHTSIVVAVTAAALLYGPLGAGMVQRIEAQQLLNSCASGLAAPDFSSSPTQMQIGKDGAAYARGTVVGNILLWFACFLAAGAAAIILMVLRRSNSVAGSCVVMRLPGRLYMPYTVLLVPTLTASTTLVAGGIGAGDAVLGAVGIGLCSCAVVVIALQTATARFMAVAVRTVTGPSTIGLVQRWAKALLAGQSEWTNRRRAAAQGYIERWGHLFEPYVARRQWFCIVESAFSAAAGVLAGLVLLDDGDGVMCGRLQLLSVFTSCASVTAIVLLRPFCAPVDHALAVSNAVITAGSAMFGAFGVDTALLTALQAYLNAVGATIFFAALLVDHRLFNRGEVVQHSRRPNTAQAHEFQTHAADGSWVEERSRALQQMIVLICNRQFEMRGEKREVAEL